MGGPPGLFFAEMMKSFHDSVYDLPEDFFARSETGIDPDVRIHLEEGLRAGQRITRIRNWAWTAVALGLILLVGSPVAAIFIPSALLVVLGAGVIGLVTGILLYGFALSVYLAHRTAINRFVGYIQASRTSSLGRDLA